VCVKRSSIPDVERGIPAVPSSAGVAQVSTATSDCRSGRRGRSPHRFSEAVGRNDSHQLPRSVVAVVGQDGTHPVSALVPKPARNPGNKRS
jgi:hypothetical protein